MGEKIVGMKRYGKLQRGHFVPNKALQQTAAAISVCEKSWSLGAAAAAELQRYVSCRSRALRSEESVETDPC
jgi:hypothetical protein